jgi:hypothetical protein
MIEIGQATTAAEASGEMIEIADDRDRASRRRRGEPVNLVGGA